MALLLVVFQVLLAGGSVINDKSRSMCDSIVRFVDDSTNVIERGDTATDFDRRC